MQKKTALVLTGGGARAAYQAGIMKGIAEILERSGVDVPFPIVSGVSAGAINSAYIASRNEPFSESASSLCDLWSGLNSENVIKTDAFSLGKIGAKWLRDLSSAGVLSREKTTHLLDSTPLREYLEKRIDFNQIEQNLRTGRFYGLSFTATNYKTGTAVTFYDGDETIEPWVRSSRIGKRVPLTLDHVLASASIPIFFRPVPLENAYYGDGGVRMATPLSPAIHCRADRILAVGIRYSRPDQVTSAMNERPELGKITLADIGGVLMNALFLDALEADVERLTRINQTLDMLDPATIAKHPHKLRKIPLLALRPSRDLGALAADQFEKFPRIMKFLLRGLGASNDKGWDLLSYLAFDQSYTKLLLEVGYEDALRYREQIEKFLLD
jgi:NTE family protein